MKLTQNQLLIGLSLIVVVAVIMSRNKKTTPVPTEEKENGQTA
jgi:hypothetical protein